MKLKRRSEIVNGLEHIPSYNRINELVDLTKTHIIIEAFKLCNKLKALPTSIPDLFYQIDI